MRNTLTRELVFVLMLLNGDVNMRARKTFCVVAYDIVDNKRRERFSHILARYGKRVNYSVYECFFTDGQYAEVMKQIVELIDTKSDSVICYPMCVNCYTKIEHFPEKSGKKTSSVDVY